MPTTTHKTPEASLTSDSSKDDCSAPEESAIINKYVGIDKRIFEIMLFSDLNQVPGSTLVISIRREVKEELGKKLNPKAMQTLIERQLPLELYRWFHLGEINPRLTHECIVAECKAELKKFDRLCINLDFFPCMNKFLDLGDWSKVACSVFNSAIAFQGQRINLGSHVMMQKKGSEPDLLFCTYLFADNMANLCVYTEFAQSMDLAGYNNGVLYSPIVLRGIDIVSSLIAHRIDPRAVPAKHACFAPMKLALEELAELSTSSGFCKWMLTSLDFSDENYSLANVIKAIKYYNTARALRIFERKV